MSVTPFVFDNDQLNRLFPYYLLINKDITIAGYGTGLSKIVSDLPHSQLTKQFKIKELTKKDITETDLVALKGSKVTLNSLNKPHFVLSGSFEYLEQAGQFLFLSNLAETAD